MRPLRSPLLWALALALASLVRPPDAGAFCGFFVGKADAKLFNKASQVVVARNDDKTVISMMNDYEGELTEFALVVPVPVVLKQGQVHIGDPAVFKRIDAFTAPRLVEYFDADPCEPPRPMLEAMPAPAGAAGVMRARRADAKSHGVTIEAEYTVGEYDIVVLSAKESDGLETWLRENGYRIPAGAAKVLAPYIQQQTKFFVAKVNLEEQKKTGSKSLRPLQFAFQSPKFMLPIRLGLMNANGPQDLIVYLLSKSGRVETTNYRNVKLPTGMDIPVYVKGEFPDFYKSMFAEQARKNEMRAVFTEYFWNMGWCDPCADEPLSQDELKKLGVFWLSMPEATTNGMMRRPFPGGGALPVLVTRLHVRYTAETFPEDLVFQETGDQENWQARYVLRHPWKDAASETCPAAEPYRKEVRERQEKEATTLAELTGWKVEDIRKKMDLGGEKSPAPAEDDWWKKLWE